MWGDFSIIILQRERSRILGGYKVWNNITQSRIKGLIFYVAIPMEQYNYVWSINGKITISKKGLTSVLNKRIEVLNYTVRIYI